MRLGVGIVVGYVRPGVGLGDIQLGVEPGDGIRGHRGDTVSVQRAGLMPPLAAMACSMNSFARVTVSVGQISQ